MKNRDTHLMRLRKELTTKYPYGWAANLISDATFDTHGFERGGLIDVLVDGREGWGSDAGSISFPDEIVEEEGGEEAQYDHIKFAIDAGPPHDPSWLNRVPFAEALEMFELAARHYIIFHPDRRQVIEEKMVQARKTFDHLIARNEAWKNANRVV